MVFIIFIEEKKIVFQVLLERFRLAAFQTSHRVYKIRLSLTLTDMNEQDQTLQILFFATNNLSCVYIIYMAFKTKACSVLAETCPDACVHDVE